jgi:predicted acylesterase/phospholipase RssA
MSGSARRIRGDLPFRRVALVLSGGGGLGAYEVGVFRTLEAAGLAPRTVLGVSVGAINALVWVANSMRSEPLRQVWQHLRPSSVGIRWTTLGARSMGAFLMTLAGLEALLTIADVPLARLRPRLWSGGPDLVADLVGWLVVGLVGGSLLMFSSRIEDLLARLTPATDPDRPARALGWTLVFLGALLPVSYLLPIPWPRRLHLVLVLFAALAWLAGRQFQRGTTRRLASQLLPETGGRGLWRSAARRRLIDALLPQHVDGSLFDGSTHLILTACNIRSGRMHYFINWDGDRDGYRERVRDALGEAAMVRNRHEIIEAALASSAVPVIFEPVRIGGEEFVDGGVFTNQPLHAVLADRADAVLLVLVLPSGTPPRLGRRPRAIDLAARLPHLANWRDLQIELQRLPPGWSRAGSPARLCVVEPRGRLPGRLLTFEPAITDQLIRRGENDAWRALEAAGWLEDEPAARSGRGG